MNGQFCAHVEMLTGVDNIFQYYYSVALLNARVSVFHVELQFVQLIKIFSIYYGSLEVQYRFHLKALIHSSAYPASPSIWYI
jgi:hypothetical protein